MISPRMSGQTQAGASAFVAPQDGPGSGRGSAKIAFLPRISQLIGLSKVVGAGLREGRRPEW